MFKQTGDKHKKICVIEKEMLEVVQTQDIQPNEDNQMSQTPTKGCGCTKGDCKSKY